MKSKFFLIRIHNGDVVSKFTLFRGPTVIGRSLRSDICLADSSVSRRHAQLSVSNEGVSVLDLKSRNGTFIDGRLISSGFVHPGQDIRFGTVSLILSSDQSLNHVLGEEYDTADPRIPTNRPAKPRAPMSLQSAAIRLTSSQQRVFDLLIAGLTEQQVAEALGISQATVHNHASAIYRAFGVHSRAQLLAAAIPQLCDAENTMIMKGSPLIQSKADNP